MEYSCVRAEYITLHNFATTQGDGLCQKKKKLMQ